ncbi:MAG: hypothetical protein SOU49_01215 [Sodaliphilus pleomorphus]|uniref:hypothetical protein n=1 Tax=Sodaliphilus pleomorphus TaxID=2606626 RepID=UPI0023F57D4F|nr:hypothetical protein [Sodaliphilus pleomorphus]MDD7065425.1 hypothetical protein [Sodaliphilus pleomorphus]MDY2831351.1 hypothetical protein [Sodaliphilus pleomorphus]
MKAFVVAIRILESILLALISAFIIHAILVCRDQPTLIHYLKLTTVGILWIFPISLPLAACIVTSLIKSIPPKTIYKKTILGFHLFNFCAIPLVLIFLPNHKEPTAQMMANNLITHYKAIARVVDSIDDLTVSTRGFDYVNINGEISRLNIKIGNEWLNKNEIETLWAKGDTVSSISPQELYKINKYMQQANIQGIDINDEEDVCTLLFRRWGRIDFEYKFYKSKEAARKDYDSFGQSKQFIMYNDTIAFTCTGIYPGGGSFVDYERFYDFRRRSWLRKPFPSWQYKKTKGRPKSPKD